MFNNYYEYPRENDNCCEFYNPTSFCNYVSCEEILKEYHELIKEIECLNYVSDNIISEVLDNILNNLKKLEKAINLKVEAISLEKKADYILNNNNCYFKCNKDFKCCESLKEKSECFYNLENKEIIASIRFLKEAVCSLKKALFYGEQRKRFETKYKKCIHENKCDFCE